MSEYLTKNLGEISCVCETSFCVFLVSSGLSLELSHDAIFDQALELQLFQCCFQFFDELLDKSLLHSWSKFGRSGHHWKGSPLLLVFSIRMKAFTVVLNSTGLSHVFVTFSRLIHDD